MGSFQALSVMLSALWLQAMEAMAGPVRRMFTHHRRSTADTAALLGPQWGHLGVLRWGQQWGAIMVITRGITSITATRHLGGPVNTMRASRAVNTMATTTSITSIAADPPDLAQERTKTCTPAPGAHKPV